MLERFGFYIRHSLNDMSVNKQRTFFALLCIAAGVAAIVSLQTLAVMIESTLTGNLQGQNLSDVRLSFSFGSDFESDDEDSPFADDGPRVSEQERQAAIDRDLQAGLLQEPGEDEENPLFGSFSQVTLTADGLREIEDYLQSEYGEDAVEVTYRMFLSEGPGLIFGQGTGVNVSAMETDTSLSNHAGLIVNPAEYPFYDTVETVSGQTLQEVFAAHDGPNLGIVLSRDSARDLGSDDRDLQIGDTLRISGSNAEFTVLGFVPTDTEIRDFETGFTFGLFGYYYYITPDALQSFDQPLKPTTVYIKLDEGVDVNAVEADLVARFPYLNTTTTEDLRQQNEIVADNLDTLVTIMGLLSLLLGSIGIINTMQVVVRRRTLEIAVLKTLGLQGNQVTILFLTEAFIMGVLGSIGGVLLGWGSVFVIRTAAETLLRQGLEFQIALEPVVNGMIVGTLVTTVFGFLPTLSAAQVRPGVVLRPTEAPIPRTGWLTSSVTLLGMVVVLSLIAQSILGSTLMLAFGAVAGAFVAAGVILLVLWFLIWVVGRVLPSFGLVDVKLSKRQVLATRARGAITLLALVVAVFSLSTITLFADSFTNFLDDLLNQQQSEPVIIQPALPGGINQVEQIVQSQETVEDYTVNRIFSDVSFASLNKADGTSFESTDAIEAYMGAEVGETELDPLAFLTLNAYEKGQIPDDYPIIVGQPLEGATTSGDALPLIFPESPYTRNNGIEVGDRLVFTLNGNTDLEFEVVGIQERPEVSMNASPSVGIYTLWSAIQQANVNPSQVNITASLPEEEVVDLRRAVEDQMSGVFVFDIRNLTGLIDLLLQQFRAFPTMVALLGLVVGGVVIANSVALSTLERRDEIAVMKSVGLQRERVLGMILTENGLLGLVGGLLGVGSGLITLAVLGSQIELPLDAIPYGVAALLMLLCIGVAVIAAMTTAWGASGEKPLNVLRYE